MKFSELKVGDRFIRADGNEWERVNDYGGNCCTPPHNSKDKNNRLEKINQDEEVEKIDV